MNKKIHIVFLFLSLFALLLIGHDYVYGHFDDDHLCCNTCLLCKAFQSTELASDFPAMFLFFGIMPVIGFFSLPVWFKPQSIYLSAISLRAPPPLKYL